MEINARILAVGLSGLVATGLLAFSQQASADEQLYPKREELPDIVAVSDDDDDDGLEPMLRDDTSRSGTGNSGDASRTGAASGRDDSRSGRRVKDWTGDNTNTRKRDWSQNRTNDRSRHNTR